MESEYSFKLKKKGKEEKENVPLPRVETAY